MYQIHFSVLHLSCIRQKI